MTKEESLAKAMAKQNPIVAIATNKYVLGIVVIGGGLFIAMKTKGFGLFKPKGQKDVEVEKQEAVVYVQTAQGNTVPQTVQPLSDSEAVNMAISFHDTLSEAWDGLGTGWFGWSPSVEAYNRETGRLIGLSNQQLAQVVNAYSAKYRTDTYNTVRAILNEVSVTTASSVDKKRTLLAKLTSINA